MKQTNFKSRFLILLIGFLTLSVVNVWGVTYTKITSLDALTTGQYVIVGGNVTSGAYAMNSTFSSSYWGRTSVSISQSKITDPNTAIVWTITKESDGKYSISQVVSSQKKYVGFTGTSNNNNSFSTTLDNKSKFTVSYSNSVFTFANANYTSRYIKYNSGASRFSNYLSTTGVDMTLYKQDASYTIIAQSNDINYGTVSVDGDVITGEPKAGYTYANPAYTVIEGTATVEQDGDEFTVTTSEDCTIQINFAEKQSATVTLSKAGTDTPVEGKYVGDTYELPESVTETCGERTFVGWSTEQITTPGSKPTSNFYEPGAEVTLAATNKFYAVYATASGSGTPTWNLVSDVASLTVGSQVVIAAAGGTNYAISTTQNTNNRAQAEITKSASPYSTITLGDEVQIFEVKAGTKDNTIAFYTGSGYIYAASSSSNYLRTEETLSDNSSWSVTFTGNNARISANGTNSRNDLKYNSSNNPPIFSCYDGGGDLFIYKKTGGTTYSDYTTSCTAPSKTSISYNKNTTAAVTGNIPATVEQTNGEAYTVSTTTLSRTGYDFVGWNTDKNATSAISSISGDDITGTPITLYAIWSAKSYNVTFNGNGATEGEMSAQSINFDASANLTANVFVRTGYTFSGWAESAQGEKKYDDQASYTMTTEGAELYAVWTPQVYDITYKDQGDADFSGTHGANCPTKHTYGTATNLVSPTKTHYTFSGWFGNSECSGDALTSIPAEAYTANFTLYAKWKADQKYAATFYVNEQVYGTAVEYFEGENVDFPTTNPSAPSSCSDKVFTGWTNEANKDYKSETTAPAYVTSATMGTAAVNFYAVFANASGESNVYVKGALSELQTGKKVVLVHPGTTNYAVSSASSTENYLDAVSVAIASQKITSPATALIWQVTKNDNLYKFDQGVSKILRVNDTGLYASSTDASFMISTRSSSYELKDASVSAYIDYWTNFTTYSSSHNDNCIDFYIQSIAYSNYATKCKECENAITITKGTESNGKFELSKTGVVCLDDVQGGYSVTVTADPDEHYHFASVSTSSGNAGTISDNQCVVSGITANTTITAVFEMDEKVTVTWHVNGATSTTTNVYEGTAFADVTGKPSVADNATDCGNKFMGWATALITKEEATASDVSWATETTISSSNKDFYAVWATEDGSQGGSYTLNFSDASEYDLGYGVQQEVTAEDGSKWVVKAYKGNDGMQINKGKNSSIKIPTCPGNISSINIIGSASVIVGFSADDYSGGDVSDVSYIVLGSAEQDQTLDFTGKEVKAGYVVPNGGSTQISKVVVNYGGGTTASNYITTCAAAVNHTLTVEVSPASSGTITNPTTSSVELAENKGTQALAVTAAEGYGFKTWQFNGEASGATLNNPTSTTEASVKMGTANITLTAVFAPLRTVTLSNGQDPEATQVHGQYIAETEIAVPANPFKVTGKKFNGWQVEGVAVTGATYTMPDKDVKFVAQWVDAPATMWELVEDAKDLKDGDLFIMAYISQSAKYTAGSNVNNRYLDKLNMNASCFEDEYLVSVPEGTQLFTLVSVPNNLWKLQNEKGEVLAAYKAQSYIYWQTEDLLDDEDVPTYTIANSAPKTGINIVCSTTTYGRLCVNTASPRFANYTNTTDGYPNPSIYRYKGSTYKLTFDANGGEDAPTTQSTTFGSNDITITSVKPTRENYDFLCWNTKANGSGTDYYPEGVITLSENTTLYAKWLLHQEYSVVYDINGGTGTTPVDATKYVAGDYVTLKPATGFTKAGYNFVGWIDKNGYYYTAGSSDEFEMPVGGATLKALWYSAYSFTRVTDVNSLHEGDKIIIVDRTSELVAGDVYDDTYLEQISLSGIASNNTTNKVPYEGNVFTLEKDNDGYWNLINWQGSKLSAGNKKVTYDGTLDYWQISIESSGAATITVTDGSTVYKMWSNYNADRFATYTSDQSGAHIPQIYRLDNYTREAGKFSNGKISTVCLPYAVNEPEDIVGCTVYEITGKELKDGDPYKVFFDQVFSMEAGKPYVVELDENATEAKFFYSGTAVDEPNNENTNGLVGTFTAIDDELNGNTVLMGNYMIYSNQIKKCGEGCLVGKNKAYIKMNLVPEENGSSAAPGRRLTLGVEQAQTPTDVVNVNANENANVIRKVIINNQMFIIRGGKMYNASGALVK